MNIPTEVNELRPQSRPHIARHAKKARRKRTIKNYIVDLDDVSVAAGPEYINWVRIAKKKLLYRELVLLRKRQCILDQLVRGAIQQFITDRKWNTFDLRICLDVYEKQIRYRLVHSQSAIMSSGAKSMGNLLQQWKGYKPQKQIASFRDYFKRCRQWCDNHKAPVIAMHFWIPSMELIREFAMKAAARLFGGNQDRDLWTSFTDYLHVLVLRSAFEGYIKPPNGRSMWLVSAMSYRTFLKRYNHHLHVVVKTQPKKDKAMRTEYLKGVEIRYGALTKAFDRGMKKYLSPSVCVSPQVENQINPFNTTTNVLLVFESNGSMVGDKISF
eukprot:122027_1